MFNATLVYIAPTQITLLSMEERESLVGQGVLITEQIDEAIMAMENNAKFASVLVAPDTLDMSSEKFLRICNANFSALTDLQIIVTDDPCIILQGLAHEFGIKNFWPRANLGTRLQSWLSTQQENLETNSKDVYNFLQVGTAAAQRNWAQIKKVAHELEKDATSDFRIAHVLGQYHLANQENAKAEEAFQSARKLNPLFIPAAASLATVKLNSGKAEDALAIFEKLDSLNETNPDRKALMASACADLGRWEDAEKHMNAAEKLDPSSTKVAEMKARVLFHANKTDEAIAVLGNCSTVNDYFLTKLNEEAIKLSKSNQTDSAIKLYISAHKLAPDKSKYKLSYNISLAYKRTGKNKEAIMYAKLAQKESPTGGNDKITALLQSLTVKNGNGV